MPDKTRQIARFLFTTRSHFGIIYTVNTTQGRTMEHLFSQGDFCHYHNGTHMVKRVREERGIVILDLFDPITNKTRPVAQHIVEAAPSIKPPTYPLSGETACLLVRQALSEHGFPRTSMLNGAELTGWIGPNIFGSTGFSVKVNPKNPAQVFWNIVISGKPHLKYEEYEENQGTDDDPDYIDLHEPINPNGIAGDIGRILRSALDLEVISVEHRSHQTHWDDDVEYSVTTLRPSWLMDAIR